MSPESAPVRATRGMTLIELMISVALLGISTALSAAYGGAVSMGGVAELQRARASEVLEYAAERTSSGHALEPAVLRRLTADLPASRFDSRAEGGATALKVTWKAPTGEREALSLVVLAAGAHR